MNLVQIGLFLIYCCSVCVAGTAIVCSLKAQKEDLHPFYLLGETLLLGAIVVVGEMLVLSLVGLYRGYYLWLLVMLQFLFLLRFDVRLRIKQMVAALRWNCPALWIFIAMLVFFLFRNCYFITDVDSHSTYLFAQKLWLELGTSVQGDVARDIRVFAPHFNAVPYALGLAFFGTDTIFAQLVVASWTVVVLLLVFGYCAQRFNAWYGLAAAGLIVFNDHVFFSGANRYVIINSALMAMIVASAIRFWKARQDLSGYSLLMALIFASQLPANKYQSIYFCVALVVFGMVIVSQRLSQIKAIVVNKRYGIALLVAVASMLLWYLKNYLATGVATFPILADRFGAFGWNEEMTNVFNLVYGGGQSLSLIVKYFSYLMIWPGINAAKIVFLLLLVMPILWLKNDVVSEDLKECGYWLSLSVLFVVCLCLVTFVDPRHYRYGLGLYAIGAVVGIHCVVAFGLGVRNRKVIGLFLATIGLSGVTIGLPQGGFFQSPSIGDNVGVVTNRLMFKDVQDRYFPANRAVDEASEEQRKNIAHAAWDTGVAGATNVSSFLLPTRPQVGLFHTTVVDWNAYRSPESVVKNLNDYGIESIARVVDGQLVFLSLEEYAKQAVSYDRFPKKKYYDFQFPRELTEIEY